MFVRIDFNESCCTRRDICGLLACLLNFTYWGVEPKVKLSMKYCVRHSKRQEKPRERSTRTCVWNLTSIISLIPLTPTCYETNYEAHTTQSYFSVTCCCSRRVQWQRQIIYLAIGTMERTYTIHDVALTFYANRGFTLALLPIPSRCPLHPREQS